MLASVSLWLSGWRGSKSSVHYDAFHNLLVVVAGEKRVLLWSPAETANLYPHQLGSESGNHSSVDVTQPDRHPRFRAAQGRAIAVTLHAGDALYIPEGFWHQVDSSGSTIAVNYWCASRVPRLEATGVLTWRSAQVALCFQRAPGRPHGRVLCTPGVGKPGRGGKEEAFAGGREGERTEALVRRKRIR